MSTCQETDRERRKGEERVLEVGGLNYLSLILGFSKLFVQSQFEGQSVRKDRKKHIFAVVKKKAKVLYSFIS